MSDVETPIIAFVCKAQGRVVMSSSSVREELTRVVRVFAGDVSEYAAVVGTEDNRAGVQATSGLPENTHFFGELKRGFMLARV